MKKWTVGSKIAAGYALAFFMVLTLGYFSYRNAVELTEGASLRAHTFVVITKVGNLLAALQDAETGQRGYLLVGDDSYLQPYISGVSRASQALQDLRTLTIDDAAQQRRLALLTPLINDKFDELKKTISLRKTKGFAAALKIVQTNKGKDEMDEIRKIISGLLGDENDLLNARNNFENANASSTRRFILYGIATVAFCMILIGYAVTRAISDQLKSSMSQLASTSSQILATTTQISAGAAETATAVTETTATVEEVKQTAQLASQKAKNVSESAQKASQTSIDGKKSVEDSVDVMQDIQKQMETIAERVVALSEQGLAIGEIIVSVNDLAEQSSILAVNAAIEANKAGEHGKGFSVVAHEIKSLAEQSKQSTAQVRAILTEIQKGTSAAVLAAEQGAKMVEAGMKQSKEAGKSISRLADSIAEAAQASVQIAASSQQQMVGMDQVSLAMENIKQASQQHASGTKQAEEAARNLHEISQHLGEMIGAT